MAFATCSDEKKAFCRHFQLELSPCCCLSYSKMSLSAAWVAAERGAGAVEAAVMAVVEAGVGIKSAVLAGNRRGQMQRCSQLSCN